MTETRTPVAIDVVHASPSYAPAYRFGGPIHSLEGLVDGLRRQGARVRVVTTDVQGPSGPRLDVPDRWTTWRGVPVRYLHGYWFDATPRTFDTVFREARSADVVHVTGLFNVPSMLAVAASLAAHTPVILSPRGALEGPALRSRRASSKRAWLAANHALLRRVKVFHATSDQEAASIRAMFGEVEVAVVPNGTVLEPIQRAAWGARVGAIGRIHPIKGYDVLLEATASLVRNGMSVELAIAGPVEDDEHFRSLQRLAVDLGIGPRVRFLGELRGPAKAEFLASLAVLALPSRSENFGNVVVEALAQQVPVVASTATPWQDLEHERCGRWVSGDAPSFAAALAPFVTGPGVSREWGGRGRALVERRYSWEAVARAMLQVYQRVTLRG